MQADVFEPGLPADDLPRCVQDSQAGAAHAARKHPGVVGPARQRGQDLLRRWRQRYRPGSGLRVAEPQLVVFDTVIVRDPIRTLRRDPGTTSQSVESIWPRRCDETLDMVGKASAKPWNAPAGALKP